jgi:hypothetical protein
MWYHLHIKDPTTAFSVSRQMMDEHFVLFAAMQNRDCAIFSRIDDAGGMNYYFTPSASSVAKAHGASPCGQPSRKDAGSLLCGDQTIITRLYG